MPSLPASAMTTPRTRTVVPAELRRAAAIVIGDGPLDADGAGDGDGVGDTVGDADGLGGAVGEGSMVGVGDGDTVGVGLGDSVGVTVGDGDGMGVGTGGGGLGVVVGVGDGDALGGTGGTGAAARFWASGAEFAMKSAALSFVSTELPRGPPGRRSIELPAAGADAAVPSTNEFVASPQPTVSRGSPPIERTTIAPPVAAKPPEYVASAEAA